MSVLEGVGLNFDETMSGTLSRPGEAPGPIRLDMHIEIEDLHRFLLVGEHRAKVAGTLTWAPLGGALPIRDGAFCLFRPDPDSPDYHLVYDLTLTGKDGQRYSLHGEKTTRDDPGFDLLHDMTVMQASIYQGDPGTGTAVASGEIRFDLADLPAFAASFKVVNAKSFWTEVAAKAAFLSFALGTLSEEYLKDLSPTYDTGYENVVLNGSLRSSGGQVRPFFMVTGVHDRGFPWGDGELFWDVLLVIGDGAGGWLRFAITDRILEGLEIDVAQGYARYHGPVFALSQSDASFSQMRQGAPQLLKKQMRFELTFQAKECDQVGFPFRELSAHLPSWTTRLADAVHEVLPSAHPLGIWITPHAILGAGGTLQIDGEQWAVQPDTRGEAERSNWKNVREPTLLYHYLCALDPASGRSQVQIDARTLRNERLDVLKDQFDHLVGALVARVSSADVEIGPEGRKVRPLPVTGGEASDVARLTVVSPPVLQISNDQYPTAIFERNLVQVADGTGTVRLALEEKMRLLRVEPANSTATCKVAAVRGDDKFAALDQVLQKSDFGTVLNRALEASGKKREDFQIAIKPNFMFSYSKHDRSTFTDPELVDHLARRLRAQGFTKIKLVEAQSSYGEYFDKRSVKEMAEYLGYTGQDAQGPLYEVVDLTLDEHEHRELGPKLGKHPVPLTWRDADFRISFAKNKTHAYAFYTLTLKNIYGALPLGAKFKEYHCKRGIYETTMEYLAAFPVHFGLIDAWLSADGPFGVFADPGPNHTRTILGGESLVAVDWVGATKMGIDPMVSEYMRRAVERFGKPGIEMVGDESPYWPWLNVPPALTTFTNKILDGDYAAGNVFYALMANMDSERFAFKGNHLLEAGRFLTKPLRDTFFVQTGQPPTLANRAAAWLQAKLGS